MDGWKPLTELYPQVVPGSTGKIAVPPGQSGGAATYSPYDEETQKSTQFMTLGILAIVGVVLPVVAVGYVSGMRARIQEVRGLPVSPLFPFKIQFPNFDLGGESAEYIIA
jgi:hypothetical protein